MTSRITRRVDWCIERHTVVPFYCVYTRIVQIIRLHSIALSNAVSDCLQSSRPPAPAKDADKKKKETILDLTKHMDKTVRVKFNGGREGMCVWCVWSLASGSKPLLELVILLLSGKCGRLTFVLLTNSDWRIEGARPPAEPGAGRLQGVFARYARFACFRRGFLGIQQGSRATWWTRLMCALACGWYAAMSILFTRKSLHVARIILSTRVFDRSLKSDDMGP